MPTTATTRPVRRPIGRSGFSLVEVLATMLLASIVLPAAISGISLCNRAAGQSADESQAALLASSKLEELAAAGQWQHSQMEGDFGESWPRFTWRAEVANWQQEGLSELTVTVQWQRGGRDQAVNLTTLVYAADDVAATAGGENE